jgi:hypothetical protein
MFHRQYTLLKGTPSTPAGTSIKWDLWRETYTSKLEVSRRDPTEELFSKAKVESLPEWFAPASDPTPFYDKFPDDLSEHMYFGELRHNKMCRFCTVAEEIIESDEYIAEVTKIFERLYNDRLKSLVSV